MNRFMLSNMLLTLAVALCGCGGSGDDSEPIGVTLTVSPEFVEAPADGGTYTVSVTTTGKEWGVAMSDEFFTATAQNTAAQAGTITITVPANPVAEARTGAVKIGRAHV